MDELQRTVEESVSRANWPRKWHFDGGWRQLRTLYISMPRFLQEFSSGGASNAILWGCVDVRGIFLANRVALGPFITHIV